MGCNNVSKIIHALFDSNPTRPPSYADWPEMEKSLKASEPGLFFGTCNNEKSKSSCEKFEKEKMEGLGNAFHGSNVMIAMVDCSNCKIECSEWKAPMPALYYTNWPLIRGPGNDHLQYKDAKSFIDMKIFIKKTLKGIERTCNPGDQANCLPSELPLLETLNALDVDEIKKQMKLLKQRLKTEAMKESIRNALDGELTLMKAVIKYKKGAEKSEL